MDQYSLKRRIDVSTKRVPADIVIKNGKIIDVFNLEIISGDVAIVDGFFAGIGEYEGRETIDAADRYICPAFIDGHVHIESSMVTPAEFTKVLLAHGVTTVITDPHEIGNVSGKDGLTFMLDQSEGLPLDVRVMLPSSVPATPFENAGAVLTVKDLEPFYKHPRVKGLAEVMDFPAVFNGDEDMLNKIASANRHDRPFEKVNEEIIRLKDKLKDLGFKGDFDPFLTLSFLTLPVIPEIKLTDLGLFDFKTFQHISVKAN
ncbi:hypothetical protein ABE41_019970 [Fictibacillus arsenicus]|uniref:Amidohydrolase-related domain-containing protein n=1 Tax=Fictibacillus arsenicus TaxID=255247 RepID=A0A1B1ZA38_9BACL|nr:hypothetical protein ABE41_019970 [Fictibacillus arsenicus]